MNTSDPSGFKPFVTSLIVFVLLSLVTGCVQSSIARNRAPEPAVNNKDDSPPHILAPLYNAGHIDPGVSVDKPKSPFYPSRARTSAEAGLLNIELFDPPETCWACHTDIYDQWKGSMHSNAWHDPVYRALMRLAVKATNGLTDNICIGCHTPVGLTTGEASPTGERMGEISKNGVFCEVCHNLSASTGIGNTAIVLTPRKYGRPLKFGPFKDARSPYHDTEYSDLHTTSAL